MIERDIAKKQVKRMSGLDFFPQDAAAITEIIRALEASPNDEVCKRLVDRWLEDYSQAPKPADIRRILSQRASTIRNDRAACQNCHGNTWIGEDYLVEYYPNTFRIKSYRKVDFEEAHVLRPTLTEQQAIIGAARACPVCRPNYVPEAV